jgi:hypothetical protein
MMVDAEMRLFVTHRALERCEYCRVHQDDFDFFTFHVEHIIARQHGGSDDPLNLCLACRECNFSKGPNLTGLLDGKIVPLFHPRRQVWKRHFRWEGGLLVGKTRCGKVTVQVLAINNPARLMVRQSLWAEGRFPPSED